MNKDQLKRLETYAKHLQERLSSPVPPKHVNRAASLQAYLNKELSVTKAKIDAIKLGSAK